MVQDQLNRFCTDQAVTAAALSDDWMSSQPMLAGNGGVDWGNGEPLHFIVRVTETMDDTGDDSSIRATLESDSVATMDSTPTVHASITIPALTAAGTEFSVQLPVGVNYEDILRARFAPSGGDLSAGKFSARLGRAVAAVKQHASGYNW